MEAFLGGGQAGTRQRQRLQQRELLPKPYWLPRIDRLRVGVYPAFALVGLLTAGKGEHQGLNRLEKLSRKVFSTFAFRDMAKALETSIRDVVKESAVEGWRFDAVVERLTELGQPAVIEWDAVMREALESLTPWGIEISNEFGHVARRSGNVYFVSVGDERIERFSNERVAAQLQKGAPVAVERVRVMGDGVDVVMPALQAPETHPDATNLWANVSEDDWGEVFSATAKRADNFSFEADYWREDPPETSKSAVYDVPLNALSGREAAAHLLAQRAQV